jgi:rfaE bifunctional protein nucleotidyltransferase chain/domain
MALRDKIVTVEALAELLKPLRHQNQKIVHCHGVFDLLHIGHIRHFHEAKGFGDILIITITPDRYVNKGPHRPAFSEEMRVEAIAALDCIDFVAINQWPTAVEVLHHLQPHFYVKGPDYKKAEEDRTGGILREEEAINAVGGQLVFTKDVTFSSSNLINRHLPIFPKEVSDYLTQFAAKYTLDEVVNYLEKAHSLKVLVVGEAIIDEYQYCEGIGKSSKEPTLVVKQLSQEKFAGGILAVGNHVANFCEQVGMITFLGSERSQEDFIRNKLNRHIKPIFLYRKDSPTIVKRRFVENYFFTKLLEVYEINDGLLDKNDNEQLCAILREQVPLYDIVIMVDFGHSMMSKEAIEILSKNAKFLALNVQSNAGNLGYHTLSTYPRADYVSIAENEIRLETRDRRGHLRPMVKEIAQNLGCKQVAVTRGKRGSLCYSADEEFFEIPAFANQIVDRIGAGDASLSITALCAAQQAPMEIVGFIGNAVGAQAVATVGNRNSIERVSLIKHIESLLK